jgi:hypothetical protein
MESTSWASTALLVALLSAALIAWLMIRSILRLTRRIFTLGCLGLLLVGGGVLFLVSQG